MNVLKQAERKSFLFAPAKFSKLQQYLLWIEYYYTCFPYTYVLLAKPFRKIKMEQNREFFLWVNSHFKKYWNGILAFLLMLDCIDYPEWSSIVVSILLLLLSQEKADSRARFSCSYAGWKMEKIFWKLVTLESLRLMLYLNVPVLNL